MMGNNQEWMNRFFEIADKVHEKIWQLPADREYEEQLRSEIADMKNTGGRDAGAITAGLFIKQFVDPHTPWIHLDIAWYGVSMKRKIRQAFSVRPAWVSKVFWNCSGGGQQ
jgi:leucyl aminopeptidase